jgi:NADPH:quinone reductase-like Zn-dependent oxidoreductase
MYAKCLADMLNLQPVTRPVPQPKAGEILIQVYATGGTPAEKLWYTPVIMRMARHDPRRMPGHEFSGIVAGLAILAHEKCR